MTDRATVLDLNGNRFVFGIDWRDSEAAPYDELRGRAKVMASGMGVTHVIIIVAQTAQLGFCRIGGGNRALTFAAADAFLQHADGKDAGGVFDLPGELHWIIACAGGKILYDEVAPASDRSLTRLADIGAEAFTSPDPALYIARPPGHPDVPLLTVVALLNGDWDLQPADPVGGLSTLRLKIEDFGIGPRTQLLLGVGAAASLGLYVLLPIFLPEPPPPPALELVKPVPPRRVVDRPYAGLPTVPAALAGCWTALDGSYRLDVAGWTPLDLNCVFDGAGGTARVSYQGGGGSFAELRAVGAAASLAASFDYQKGSATLAAGFALKARPQGAVGDIRVSFERLADRLRSQGFGVTLAPIDDGDRAPVGPPKVGADGLLEIRLPAPSAKLSLVHDLPPTEWATDLDEPGLVINALAFRDGKWATDLTLYGEPTRKVLP